VVVSLCVFVFPVVLVHSSHPVPVKTFPLASNNTVYLVDFNSDAGDTGGCEGRSPVVAICRRNLANVHGIVDIQITPRCRILQLIVKGSLRYSHTAYRVRNCINAGCFYKIANVCVLF